MPFASLWYPFSIGANEILLHYFCQICFYLFRHRHDFFVITSSFKASFSVFFGKAWNAILVIIQITVLILHPSTDIRTNLRLIFHSGFACILFLGSFYNRPDSCVIQINCSVFGFRHFFFQFFLKLFLFFCRFFSYFFNMFFYILP